MFDQGLASAALGVGLHQAISPFRSSDIWVTGSGSEKIWKTGWLGRMFKYDYPDYPSSIPEHPLEFKWKVQIFRIQAEDVNMGTIMRIMILCIILSSKIIFLEPMTPLMIIMVRSLNT